MHNYLPSILHPRLATFIVTPYYNSTTVRPPSPPYWLPCSLYCIFCSPYYLHSLPYGTRSLSYDLHNLSYGIHNLSYGQHKYTVQPIPVSSYDTSFAPHHTVRPPHCLYIDKVTSVRHLNSVVLASRSLYVFHQIVKLPEKRVFVNRIQKRNITMVSKPQYCQPVNSE